MAQKLIVEIAERTRGGMADVIYPNSNVTFVFTDIKACSRMTEELEKTRVGLYEEKLRDPHRKLLRELAQHGHEIHSVGDGHLFVFQFVEEALACVVAFQQEMHRSPITHTENGVTYEVKVRVGVHTAMVQRRPEMMINGLPEYPGGDTNYASRIGDLGAGGQIIVSQSAYTHAQNLREYAKSPCAVQPWLGRFLKDFPGRPHNVYEVLYYKGQEPQEPGMRWFSAWYRNDVSRFVERPVEEKKVFKGFENKAGGGRLVTITGIGGTGKTRLAIACAVKRADLYHDGVYFVSLATADLATDPDAANVSRSTAFVAQAIGAALNRTGEAATPQPLFAWLQTQNLLLVLDNYESVHCPEAGEYLTKLAAETAGVALLVTGRQPVGVNVEALVNLNGGMGDGEARELFLNLARLKGKLQGELTPEEQAHLGRVLTATDHIPLALELAAAQIEDYTLLQIAQGIEALPLGDMSEAPELRADDPITFRRHQSLERSLRWSYNLLDAAAQRVLATASLFADTFDKAVLEAAHGDAEAGRGLRSLRKASLVYEDTTRSTPQAYRFRLHRATREFAAQRLAESDAADAAKRQFVAHYVAFVEENKDKQGDLRRHPALDNEWRNAVAAANLAEALRDHGSVMFLSQLGGFLRLRGLWSEQERLYLQALASARASNGRENEGKVLHNLGVVYKAQGRWQEAITAYEQSLVVKREYGDRVEEGQTLMGLGNVYEAQGRWAEAITAHKAALLIFREFVARASEGQALNNLGTVYQAQRHWDEAIRAYEQSLVVKREYGDRVEEGQTLMGLGNVYEAQGRWAEAITAHKAALLIFREFGARASEGQALNNLGLVYDSQGRWQEAIAAYEQSLVFKREYGDRVSEGKTLANLGNVYQALERWDEAVTAYEQSLAIFRDYKDGVQEGITLYELALLEQARGDRAQALVFARRSVEVLATTQAVADLKDSENLVEKLERAVSPDGSE